MAATTAARDLAAELAYLTRALKGWALWTNYRGCEPST